MASRPKTPAPTPREMFNPEPMQVVIGGKFTGQVNAVETEDGVVVEQTNRRGTKKVLLRLSYPEACGLALRLAAAGRRLYLDR